MYRQVLVLAVFAACLCGFPASCARNLNYRPIIGILAQENLEEDPHAQGTSYIAASYVKHLESAGARVVPIRINRTEEEYETLFNAINGLLLPGGNVDIETSQFTRAARIFYELALKANDASDYFPIWGTCQGFQQFTVLTSNKNLLTLTDTKAVALPLTFSPGAQNSRLFKKFPKDVLQSLAEENITSNFHSWSLSTQHIDIPSTLYSGTLRRVHLSGLRNPAWSTRSPPSKPPSTQPTSSFLKQ
ncbi:zgc:171566 isoform X1 [Danio rerio]|uniref:Zgc:171566 isoform X1 n=1 Tax=Danio rerio TaxID=7955 RepID=A0AC58IEU1_DANRE|nr:uncharacterized protein LOC563836 isoform X1 [Danio rerio]|eukprot:XP_021325014.1 uncharacterized protein LOC563836 isoform X1 [Danio rerio]